MQQVFEFDHHLMLENDVEALIFKTDHDTTQVQLLLKVRRLT